MPETVLFQQNIKAALFLCKIAGLNSITRDHRPNNRYPYYFRIKLFAFTNISFVLFRLFTCVCGAIEILLNLRKTTIIFIVPILDECIAIFSNILSIVVCIRTDKLLIDVIARLKLNSYRYQYPSQPRLSRQSRFRSRFRYRYIWIGICVVSLCAYLFGNFITDTDTDTKHSRNNSVIVDQRTPTSIPAPTPVSSRTIRIRFVTLCSIYEKLTYVLMAVLFFIFADEIKEELDRFNEEIRELREQVHSVGTRKSEIIYNEVSATGIGILIENYRRRYENLVIIAEKTNSSVGSRLLVPLILMPARICIQFYNFVYHGHMQLSFRTLRVLISSATLFTLTYILIIYGIALSGSLISQTSYRVFQSLNSISVAGLRPELQLMIQIFQEHMSIRPVMMTAAGFIRIEKRFITSIFLSIATYCMVILQLHNPEE